MPLVAAITLLTNIAFRAAWDDVTRCPAWVAYDLEPCEVVAADRAAIPFRADERAAGSDVAADYAGSGFDRGHMAPAADFNFDRAALAETYLFSNVCPMSPALNRGRWARFEEEIRDLARSGTVHVVCWPEYDIYPERGYWRIGRVAVPSRFVKVAHGWFGIRRIEAVNFLPHGAEGENENKERKTK